MSEVRRRKIRNESEALSDTSFEETIKTSDDVDVNTTVDSTAGDGADSEYETVGESGSESDDLGDDGREITQSFSEKEDNCEDVILDLERQSGDGEEQDTEKKKVDDDEDRSNPQYIPKRGTFYEHDDRTAEDGVPDGAEAITTDTEQETQSHTEKNIGKKTVWQQSHDRWSHDRYDEGEQAPKSRSELIAAYGYDIRNEEGPPKARRRHRYGHGPNKYTRNWEDLEAYGKQKIPQRKPKPEDFPALQSDNTPTQSEFKKNVEKSKVNEDTESSKSKPQNIQNSQDYTNKQSNDTTRPRYIRNKFNKSDKKDKRVNEQNENQNKGHYAEIKEKGSSTNEQDPKNKRLPHEKHHMANSFSAEGRLSNRAFKNRNTLEFKSQNRNKSITGDVSSSQNTDDGRTKIYDQYSNSETRNNLYDLQKTDSEVDNIVSQSYCNTKMQSEEIENTNNYSENDRTVNNRSSGTSSNGNHKNSNVIPPRLQGTEASRPKRYSSLRQRSVQETNNMQNQQVYQQGFYTSEYTAIAANEQNIGLSNNSPQSHIQQPLNNLTDSSTTQATPTNMSLPPPQTMPYVPETVPTQVITTSNQVLPQVLAPQYLPNAMQFGSGGPYMTPNNTFLQQPMGYPVPPPQHSAPTQYTPQYPTYPAPTNFSAVPNPPAAGPMFQPQGGITYYSPQGQPLPPRLAPRRPRSSAIPIVPPPTSAPNDAASPPLDNVLDNDNDHNIDHIVDNMFVQRHPYDPNTNSGICSLTTQVKEIAIEEIPTRSETPVISENETEHTKAKPEDDMDTAGITTSETT